MQDFFNQYWWLIVFGALWELAWKGFALWKAAKLGDKIWFVALLILNTVGILEILYIFVFSKRTPHKNSEV